MGPFPVYNILTEHGIKIDALEKEHPAPWLELLLNGLRSQKDIILHVLVETPYIFNRIIINKNNVYYHIVRSGSTIPFTKINYPSFIPIDILLRYNINKFRMMKEIRIIRPDLIHAHGTEFSYSIVALKSKIPTIISIQGLINLIFSKNKNLSVLLKSKLEKSVLINGHYFIPKTQFVKDYIEKLNPSAFCFDINDTINEIYFKNENLENDGRQILFVGSLIKSKGIEDIIKAMVKINDTKLCVVGNSPERKLRILFNKIKKFLSLNGESYFEYLQRLVFELNLTDRIEFKGKQSPEVIAKLLSKSKVLVLPSYMENSPNVVMEALSSGVPVVAYRVGGLPEFVLDGFNGFLVEVGDIEGLAIKINEIIKNDALFQKMSTNARGFAKERFDSLIAIQKTIDAYKMILGDV